MLNFIRTLIPDPMRRALVLKLLRWISAAAAGALVPWLVKNGISAADAATIAAAVGALILGGGSALFSWLDARAVDQQVTAAHASGAASAASAILAGAATPAQIQTAAMSGPDALAKVIPPVPGQASEAALAAGKF